MRYGILGPVEVRADDDPLYVGGPRERRTLAALLLNANRQVRAERLAELLWDERPPPTAKAQIRNTIAALRRHLAARAGSQSPIESAAGGYILRISDDQLDATAFDAHVRRGRALAGQGRLGDAGEALRVALGLWRGPALDGVPGRVFEAEAAGLEERRLVCLEQRVEWDLAVGRHRELVGELATLVGAHPLRERLVEAQMTCLYRVGRPADALDAFMAARTRFAEQTGLDPSARLVRLQRAILCADPSLDLLVADDRDAVSPPGPRRPTPAQLPADVPAFTGRAAELKALDGLLPDSDTVSVVAAITGTAGVGKTALAVHWAHRVRHRFGDGQLYVNLRGFDPVRSAVTAKEALPGFLDALGVPPDCLPVGVDAQAALYRSLLSERRMLVVLDNAGDAAEVRPLLPGTPGCVAVVTSRHELRGLVAAECAHPVGLDLLSSAEGRELLTRRLGPERVMAESQGVDEIVRRCSGLPIALVVVAARAATRPELSLNTLADELRGARDALDAFAGDDAATDLRTVFFWSYRNLSLDAARLFRLLGRHPGPARRRKKKKKTSPIALHPSHSPQLGRI